MTVKFNRGQFRFYPSNRLVGMVDGADTVQVLLDDLLALKLQKSDLGVLCGDAGLRWLDDDGSRHGLLGRFVRWTQFLTDERAELRQYEDAVASGLFLVAAQLPHQSAVYINALTAYQRAKASLIRYFGPLVIEALDY
ncbi:hypothetical protein ACFP9V_25695 [Deinococcus radiopugnans]|uniref:Uncharacterized protein n=1 Tax=Deinococcus radiopugnans ATCC 19172 TaxID=585398 RepID=A0A5C4XX47_9DEIO|nr:hypothetical protein [Deinococcus radiopugnans]MBB6018589.1 hypothetical protein [Deinococcus radiopugnans ATCC 19172]TNM67290.1 hypothetical protein FHR04_18715 [Deinococcus radiopugnans ATCC 19172]